MEYKVKLSQTFLPYLLVLLVIIGVTVYLDQLSGTYSAEKEVIAIAAPGQSGQIALWQPELDETLPQAADGLSEIFFEKGLQAYKEGEWEQARKYWHRLVEQHPEATEAWEMLGRGYIKSQRYRAALHAFQQSLTLDSTYGPALRNIGSAYAGLQQYHQAEAAYRFAALQSPENPLPYLNLGIILNQQQRWTAAINELQKASEQVEEGLKAKSKYYEGFAYLQLQDTLTAIRHFQEAKALQPSYVRPQIQEILLSSASAKEKEEALLELGNKQAGETEALVYYHLANLYQGQNNPEAAGKFLVEALRTRPEDLELEISLGKHYLQQNQLTQAEMLFKRMLSLDSLLSQPYYYLAQLEGQKNNQQAAVGMFEKAISLAEGNFPEAYLGKGIAEEAMNNTESAILSYQEALNKWPDYPEAYYHMGQAYLKSNQLQQAVHAYQQSLAVQPNFAEAWYGLGLAHNLAGQKDSARLSLQRALVYAPEFVNARMALGMLQSEKGNHQAAVAHYSNVLEQYSNYLPALIGLGNAYEKTNQQKAALQVFETVLALKPGNIEAKEKLAYLYAIQRKTEKAEKLYEELVAAIPYSHKLRFNLALQYELQAEYDDAIIQLQKALELEPDYLKASKKLEDIQARVNKAPVIASGVNPQDKAAPQTL